MVAKINVGFITGFKLEYFVPNPPANKTKIKTIFAKSFAI
jgi:hypothetical protein